MTEGITAPIAVGGLRAAEKIRSVIYANNQAAHVPLTEILRLAVETTQNQAKEQGFASAARAAGADKNADKGMIEEGERAAARFPPVAGHSIRFFGNVLLQYGFAALQQQDFSETNAHNAGESGSKAEIRFAREFASAEYYPFISLCLQPQALTLAAPVSAVIAAESLRKTGFDVTWAERNMAAAAAEKAGGIFWLAIGLAV